MKFMDVKAFAKINIGLNILSKRTDGYHDLSTLFYPIVDLYDTLHFEKADRFEFFCNSDFIPKDETNLVVKAKNFLQEFTHSNLNVKITLEKRIPSQAGLGGGSSDAAVTLNFLNEIFELGLDHQKLIDLALKLGSDVPFFIDAKPSVGKSRGEILTQINLKIEEPILIVNPLIKISTKEAFQNISCDNTEIDFSVLINNGKLDYERLRENAKNDFENYVFNKYREIDSLKTILYDNGALFSLLSGSGSTVYGIFPNLDSAVNASQRVPAEYFVFISNPRG